MRLHVVKIVSTGSSIIEESKARQVCGMKDQITLESMGRNDQTVLSEGRAWATCSGYRDDAADVSDADMVQPVRRRDRGRHI